MGQALLAVARRIDYSATETGPGLSSLVLRLGVELRHIAERPAPSGSVEDEVAKARERRDRSRAAR